MVKCTKLNYNVEVVQSHSQLISFMDCSAVWVLEGPLFGPKLCPGFILDRKALLPTVPHLWEWSAFADDCCPLQISSNIVCHDCCTKPWWGSVGGEGDIITFFKKNLTAAPGRLLDASLLQPPRCSSAPLPTQSRCRSRAWEKRWDWSERAEMLLN